MSEDLNDTDLYEGFYEDVNRITWNVEVEIFPLRLVNGGTVCLKHGDVLEYICSRVTTQNIAEFAQNFEMYSPKLEKYVFLQLYATSHAFLRIFLRNSFKRKVMTEHENLFFDYPGTPWRRTYSSAHLNNYTFKSECQT